MLQQRMQLHALEYCGLGLGLCEEDVIRDVFDQKCATYLRIGLKDAVPCNTPSRAVRHALTLVILLARSELREKSIDDEHLSTKDLPQRRGWGGTHTSDISDEVNLYERNEVNVSAPNLIESRQNMLRKHFQSRSLGSQQSRPSPDPEHFLDGL